MDILTLKEARDASEKFYFTGIPCVNGHRAQRYTSSKLCVECLKGYSQKHRDKKALIEADEAERNLFWSERKRKLSPKYQISKRLFSSCRANSQRRGLAFCLTIEDIKIPNSCPVLGIPLDSSTFDHKPSVDRFDNSIGYIASNIQVISYRANRLKSDASLEEIRAIENYMSSKQ